MVTHTLLQTSFQPAIVFFLFLCGCNPALGQIEPGHTDDFQNLNVSGWAEGGVSPNPPGIVPNGGPDGDGDAFLRNSSSGVLGAGGKWVMFNQSSNWTGDYLSTGITKISMHVRNSGSQNVHLRLAYTGASGVISSDSAITIIPGAPWQSIEFVIDPQAFVALNGGADATLILSSVTEFRILSSPTPSNVGEDIAATVDIDNIHAEGISAINDFNVSEWSAFPNPSTDIVQLSHEDFHEALSVTLINVLGEVLIKQTLLPPYLIDVSGKHTGIYFLVVNGVEIIPIKIGL